MKINKAVKIAYQVIDRIKNELDKKFIKVEIYQHENYISLKCHLTDSTSIELRLLEDTERNRIKLPNSVKEYYSKGGSKKLEDDFKQYNKDAWKCEVREHLENNQILEFGIGVNDKNFSEESFSELLNNYFLEK